MTQVILASSSIYRRELLRRIVHDFVWESPNVDESIVQKSGKPPLEIAESLARAKAEEVATRNKNAIVIGSDQLVDLDGEILGKPGDESGAFRQLSQMSGKTHLLITAVAVVHDGQAEQFTAIDRLTMRRLTDVEIRRYLSLDQPFDCAGSYQIEKAGISLFDRIEAEDFTSITGLPLLKLSSVLRQRGVPVP